MILLFVKSQTNKRYGQQLCLEAWHINASSCAPYREDGSYLPQQYLHLVCKFLRHVVEHIRS